jgi:hypothetical protein
VHDSPATLAAFWGAVVWDFSLPLAMVLHLNLLLFSGMERSVILKDLARTRENIARVERHIVRQLEIIGDIERIGHDPSEAKQLLGQFKELHAQYIADQNQLKSELS